MRIAVIRLSSLGDIVLTSAPLLNLRLAYPQASITLITKARFREIGELLPEVDDLALVPDTSRLTDLHARLMQVGPFDQIVDLHGNLRSFFIRRWLAGDSRVYRKERLARWWLTMNQSGRVTPTIDRYNAALESVGVYPYCDRPQIIPRSPSGSDGNTIALAPGSAHLTKNWGEGRWRELALGQLARGRRVEWIDLMPPARPIPETAGEIRYRIGEPLRAVADALAAATVAVANDSGIMHLASAVGTPTIGLFGPTTPSLGFAPRGLRDVVVDVDEPCRPCSLHGRTPCWREAQYCFDRIDPDRVRSEIDRMMGVRERLRPAVLVDRDGTLIVNKHYLSDPSEIELESGAVGFLQAARAKGYAVVVLSNQSGVARGMFDEATVERVNTALMQRLSRAGVVPDRIDYSPYHPTAGDDSRYRRFTRCRKPGPEMAERAALRLGIDLQQSTVIGDSPVDLQLARILGCRRRPILVATGHGRETVAEVRNWPDPWQPEIVPDLGGAADLLP